MRIKVTDCETKESETYDLSQDNWKRSWACMRGGNVVMWVPPELPKLPGCCVKTSGRLWMVEA